MLKKLPGSMEQQRQTLEDTFFREQDKILIEKLKSLKKMEETKKSLKEVSGITDDAVLQKLVGLSIRPETLASLSLVPLIEVAWADGEIQPEEEKAVLKAAEQNGIKTDSDEYCLLKEWLKIKPGADLLDAWVHYVQALSKKLEKKDMAVIKETFLVHAEEVAKAAGGILGVGAISKVEKEVLKKLKKAFE